MLKYADSVKELLAIYVGLLVVSANYYSYFEAKPFIDSLWWAAVTATTLGYGDMFPVTLGGRMTAVVLMHVSLLFILPLLIGNICAKCVKDGNAFTHEEQEELKAAMKRLEDKLNKE